MSFAYDHQHFIAHIMNASKQCRPAFQLMRFLSSSIFPARVALCSAGHTFHSLAIQTGQSRPVEARSLCLGSSRPWTTSLAFGQYLAPLSPTSRPIGPNKLQCRIKRFWLLLQAILNNSKIIAELSHDLSPVEIPCSSQCWLRANHL